MAVSSQSPKRNIVRVAIGLALRPAADSATCGQVEVLITRRPSHTVYGGYWEFPGGKIHPGETPAQCLIREFLEEVALHIEPLRELPGVEHVYDHAQVYLYPFECRITSGEVQHLQVTEHRWVTPADLHLFAFPEANAPLVEYLMKSYGKSQGNRILGFAHLD